MLENYGALRGRPLAGRVEADDPDSPHYQIHVVADGARHRVAINVQSSDHSSLLYLATEAFKHPVTDRLGQLKLGFNAIPRTPGGLALDFIRANLLERQSMRTVPARVAGPDNDLNEYLDHYVQRAIRDSSAEVFAFGEPWGPEPKADQVFKFKPGRGIHDIHMNQGNDPRHKSEDGIWQDGALFIGFPSQSRWVALFLAFQSQSWRTDDHGHTPGAPLPPDGQLTRAVQIVAAMVNPTGPPPERESVTLLNASPSTVRLDGWSIAGRLQHKHTLKGSLAAGATLQVQLPSEVQLGNSGGTITLLDAQGQKVDGVAYTADQAAREGWTLVF